MRELPILMNGAMVRAVLEGRKTVTRRLVTRLEGFGKITEFGKSDTHGYAWHFRDRRALWNDISAARLPNLCPIAKVGDRLYVRETWRPHGDAALSECTGPENIMFHAGLDEFEAGIFKWRPSIHMPKWAARIWLEVTAVRVERLQDITEEQARAEGIEPVRWGDGEGEINWRDYQRAGDEFTDPRASFGSLWNAINGPGAVALNPWVWVVEFRRIEEGAS